MILTTFAAHSGRAVAGAVLVLLLAAAGAGGRAAAAPVVVVTDPKGAWSTEQRTLIEAAAALAVERFPSTEVAKCAFRSSWRGRPAKDRWEKDMARVRRLARLELVVRAIDPAERPLGSRQDARGTARVGSATLTETALTGVEIALSGTRLVVAGESEATVPGTGPAPEAEEWAGVVAHEIGHTLGLSHGAGGADWEDDYAGYFVTELGHCVASSGRHGSDRGDHVLRRERKRRFGKDVP